MSEFFPEDAKMMSARPTEVTYLAGGGRTIGGELILQNMSDDEAKEHLAFAHGVEPEDVRIQEVGPDGPGGRSVGFRRWNSSWDPHAGKGDPNLN